MTYPLGLLLRHKMARAVDEDVCPVALLVYDAGKLAVITEPRGRRRPAETLNAAKSGVLAYSLTVSISASPRERRSRTWMTTRKFVSAPASTYIGAHIPSDPTWETRESSLPE